MQLLGYSSLMATLCDADFANGMLHSAKVLRELGCDHDAIDDLKESGAVGYEASQ